MSRPEVNADGLADAELMAAAVGNETRLVTLMLANNETGCLQPVARLAELAAERGIPVHTDAVQAVGRIPVNFHALGVTTLAASAHKFHGPVGVGVLLVRRGVKLRSRLHGGGQQQGRRPEQSLCLWRWAWPRPWNAGIPGPSLASSAGRCFATVLKPA